MQHSTKTQLDSQKNPQSNFYYDADSLERAVRTVAEAVRLFFGINPELRGGGVTPPETCFNIRGFQNDKATLMALSGSSKRLVTSTQIACGR